MNSKISFLLVVSVILVAAILVSTSVNIELSPSAITLGMWAFAATIIVHAVVVGRKSVFSIGFSVCFLLMTVPSAEPISPMLHLKPFLQSLTDGSQVVVADVFCILMSTAFGIISSQMFSDNTASPPQG